MTFNHSDVGKWVIVGLEEASPGKESVTPRGGSQITDISALWHSDMWLIESCGCNAVTVRYAFCSRSSSLRDVYSCSWPQQIKEEIFFLNKYPSSFGNFTFWMFLHKYWAKINDCKSTVWEDSKNRAVKCAAFDKSEERRCGDKCTSCFPPEIFVQHINYSLKHLEW